MIERPASAPAEGEIEAFDAGWYAQAIGIGRGTVAVITPTSGLQWALLGWDMRAKLEEQCSSASSS